MISPYFANSSSLSSSVFLPHGEEAQPSSEVIVPKASPETIASVAPAAPTFSVLLLISANVGMADVIVVAVIDLGDSSKRLSVGGHSAHGA